MVNIATMSSSDNAMERGSTGEGSAPVGESIFLNFAGPPHCKTDLYETTFDRETGCPDDLVAPSTIPRPDSGLRVRAPRTQEVAPAASNFAAVKGRGSRESDDEAGASKRV